MSEKLLKAWGYQGDPMTLPSEDVEEAIKFYQEIMNFRVESRSDEPHKSAVLERDGIRMALNENGGDPTQDGVAFRVDDVEALLAEFKANGFERDKEGFESESRADGTKWKVFFVVAPDGLCYWFGENITEK